MLEVRYVFEQGLHGERGPRLLRYLLDRGADEFSIKVMALAETAAPFADAFEDELGPYEHPIAERRVISRPGERGQTRAVRLRSFNASSLDRLTEYRQRVTAWRPCELG